jgi:NitT/TauT family transport system permease protein
MDQMRTWNASKWQTLIRLRLPSSMPYLFTSLKVGIAASLVGAIVGELPINQDGGLGARMLVGSYYSQTIQIWSALLTAAALAAVLVGIVGLVQGATLKRMGMAR